MTEPSTTAAAASDDQRSALETLEKLGQTTPTSRSELDQRVAAIAKALGVPVKRAQVLISSTVVAQLLPDGCVVKGGVGVKLRFGETGTRATRDVDVVAADRASFHSALAARLEEGWGYVPPSKGALKRDAKAPPRRAFTGVVRAGKKASPAGVPVQYVMEPFTVTLSFMGSAWAAVPVEVADDEIHGLELAESPAAIADQLAAVGAALGCGAFAPVPLMSLELQIAQKLHAVTEPQSQRVHDLIDLQLLWSSADETTPPVDLNVLERLCRRTFGYRRRHAWPPVAVSFSTDLEAAYLKARAEVLAQPGDGVALMATTVEDTLAGATIWLNLRVDEVVDSASETKAG